MKTSMQEDTIQALDIRYIRSRFPVLQQQVNGHDLVYFDNAATTQKPQSVIDALTQYYQGYNANIHRGIHTLAEHATAAFEDTRRTMRAFLNAGEPEEIIFTKGTTEGINLVAQTYGRQNLAAGDEVIISAMEHHSNIVPWQLICEEKGAHLKVIPVTDAGELQMDEYRNMLSSRTRIVSVVYASNSLGTVNPVKEIIRLAHDVGAVVLIDAAQAAGHCAVDVQELDCDFLSLSAHKIYGPTGVGVLYGKRALLEAMPPYQGGGEMIKDVTFAKTTFNELPYKFEAGTPNIGDVIAMKPAIEFIQELGKPAMAAHEAVLQKKISEGLGRLPGIKLIGTAARKIGVVSFVVEGIHHFDMGMMLDARGIAIRTGHHCTQPLMDRFGIEGTNRVSLAVYNTEEEANYLLDTVENVISKRRKG